MLDVSGERGVGVVDEVAIEGGGFAPEGNRFVDGAIFELCGAATEEAEFGVGVEATAFDPAAEEQVAAPDVEGVG